MRKKVIAFIVVFLLIAGWGISNVLCDVSSTEYLIRDSKLFEKEEVEDAMDVLKRSAIVKNCGFKLDTLTYDEKLHYDEIADLEQWKDSFGQEYSIEKVIIIDGSFTVENAKVNTFLQSVFWGYAVDPTYTDGQQVQTQWVMFQNEEGHWVEPVML